MFYCPPLLIVRSMLSLDEFQIIIIVFTMAMFSSLCMLGEFDWMPDTVNVIVLDAGYFCITINFLKLSFRMQLGYLETV